MVFLVANNVTFANSQNITDFHISVILSVGAVGMDSVLNCLKNISYHIWDKIHQRKNYIYQERKYIL